MGLPCSVAMTVCGRVEQALIPLEPDGERAAGALDAPVGDGLSRPGVVRVEARHLVQDHDRAVDPVEGDADRVDLDSLPADLDVRQHVLRQHRVTGRRDERPPGRLRRRDLGERIRRMGAVDVVDRADAAAEELVLVHRVRACHRGRSRAPPRARSRPTARSIQSRSGMWVPAQREFSVVLWIPWRPLSTTIAVRTK